MKALGKHKCVCIHKCQRTSSLRPHTPAAQDLIHQQLKASYTSSTNVCIHECQRTGSSRPNTLASSTNANLPQNAISAGVLRRCYIGHTHTHTHTHTPVAVSCSLAAEDVTSWSPAISTTSVETNGNRYIERRRASRQRDSSIASARVVVCQYQQALLQY